MSRAIMGLHKYAASLGIGESAPELIWWTSPPESGRCRYCGVSVLPIDGCCPRCGGPRQEFLHRASDYYYPRGISMRTSPSTWNLIHGRGNLLKE